MAIRIDRRHRSGVILVWSALMLVLLLGMLALIVDLGYACSVQASMQAVADSAALAGASGMSVSPAEARKRALEYVGKNPINGVPVAMMDSDVELGQWNSASRVFTPIQPTSKVEPNAVRVRPQLSRDRGTGLGLFFANVLGVSSTDVGASAVAVFGSRDIVLTIDLSASMNDDSELGAISRLGRTAVENSIQSIWTAMGSPSYGKMQYKPVHITSTSYSTLLTTLGLTKVAYPYPSGSWSDYFQYVQTDSTIAGAGYQKYYGYLTLVNYWEAVQFKASQTPDLWKGPEEPVTAVKDSVSVFLAYMEQEPTDDRVGLAYYTSADGEGKTEVQLTSDYSLIESTSRHRQAGHYHEYTNIAGGLQAARDEMAARGRSGAAHVIVLLSDGNANWYRNKYDLDGARNAALDQAKQAAKEGTPIITISLGSDADLDLMQQIATISAGVHFIVPGGKNVNDYRDQLYAVFAQIAAYRPLRLVD